MAAVWMQTASPINPEEKLIVTAILIVGILEVFTDGFALCWFGMWSGLTSSHASCAVVRTLFTIVLLPWACLFAVGALNYGNLFTMNEVVVYFFCWIVLGLSLSLVVGASSKHRLNRDLRTRVIL